MDARSNHGQWLVRMEDVDTPRNVPDAASLILRTLEEYGFEWDGPVVYQSSRLEAYQQALEELQKKGLAFPCACSRKEAGEIYPGTCRTGLKGRPARSWRLRVDANPILFEDRRSGPQTEVLTETVGDFVLKRADGVFAYQLAVVVDDGWQEITDVVRGADLSSSTARQIYLQGALGLQQPRYLHLPVVVDQAGDKLSKQTKAPALPSGEAAVALTLTNAFALLGHPPPVRFERVCDAWIWIRNAWSGLEVIPPHA